MWSEDGDPESIEEILRSIAREVSRAVEERVGELDVGEMSEAIGVDPEQVREWMQGAGRWLREQVDSFGEELRFPGRRQPPTGAEGRSPTGAHDDPLRAARPHPLDMPTAEQGLALAALASGRWTVEPGTHALTAHGEGPGPSDALGLVRELTVRDWMTAEGEVTLAGRHALERWLEATKHQ